MSRTGHDSLCKAKRPLYRTACGAFQPAGAALSPPLDYLRPDGLSVSRRRGTIGHRLADLGAEARELFSLAGLRETADARFDALWHHTIGVALRAGWKLSLSQHAIWAKASRTRVAISALRSALLTIVAAFARRFCPA